MPVAPRLRACPILSHPLLMQSCGNTPLRAGLVLGLGMFALAKVFLVCHQHRALWAMGFGPACFWGRAQRVSGCEVQGIISLMPDSSASPCCTHRPTTVMR